MIFRRGNHAIARSSMISLPTIPEVPAINNELRAEMRGEMSQLRTEMLGDMSRLRTEVTGEMSQLRAEVTGEISQLRAEVRGEMSLMRGEMSQFRTELRADVKNRVGEAEKRLISWMFKLWIGQVAVTIGVILAARAIWG